MGDMDCVAFLQWCLPRLGLRWAGYRKVRRTVCKRVARRYRALGLRDLEDYRSFLEAHPEEWQRLEAFCRIPISRFCRDLRVFAVLVREVLPRLAERALERGDRRVSCWSAGCASGEEPYSLRLAWAAAVAPRFPTVRLSVLATDAEAAMLARAAAAIYQSGSLKDVPPAWLELGFSRDGDRYRLRPEMREDVVFRLEDIRDTEPEGPIDLVLCRNLVFTYFQPGLQREVLARIVARLRIGGFLVIGAHEHLPEPAAGFARLESLPIYRRAENRRVKSNPLP